MNFYQLKITGKTDGVDQTFVEYSRKIFTDIKNARSYFRRFANEIITEDVIDKGTPFTVSLVKLESIDDDKCLNEVIEDIQEMIS